MKISKSDIADAITIIMFIFSLFGINTELWNIIVWQIIILIAIVYLIIRILYKMLEKSGTHKIACSPVAYWKYKIINKNTTLLRNVHKDLYHDVFRLKQKIKRDRVERIKTTGDSHLKYNEYELNITSLLEKYHTILYEAFKLDLNITIYISSEDSTIDIDKPLLIYFLNYPSKEEGSKGLTREREVYAITNSNEKDLKSYTTSAKSAYIQIKDKKCNTNSIYDYLMTSNESSWLSNDLMKDEKDGMFYTSSKHFNEERRYNSLAAFAIIPPSTWKKSRDQAKGILQFDTIKNKVFSEKECTMLMGLMAHYLNEVLKAIEIPGYDEI